MGVGDLLWLFFMISALQPVLRQKMLEASPLRVLHRFEHARPSRAISPAASVLTVLEQKKPEDIDDQTLILADVSRKAIAQVRRTAQDLLAERMAPEAAAALAEKLATGTWTHDYAITAEEAKSLGLPVSTEMPQEVYDFMSLFPQPTRARPAVEYVPMPYRTRGRRGSSEG